MCLLVPDIDFNIALDLQLSLHHAHLCAGQCGPPGSTPIALPQQCFNRTFNSDSVTGAPCRLVACLHAHAATAACHCDTAMTGTTNATGAPALATCPELLQPHERPVTASAESAVKGHDLGFYPCTNVSS
jgi:hypothetical protein